MQGETNIDDIPPELIGSIVELAIQDKFYNCIYLTLRDRNTNTGDQELSLSPADIKRDYPVISKDQGLFTVETSHQHAALADGSIRHIKDKLSPTTVFGATVENWGSIHEKTWSSDRTITAKVNNPLPQNHTVTTEWKQQMVRFARNIGSTLCKGSDAYQVLPGNSTDLPDRIELRILVCKRDTTQTQLVNKQFSEHPIIAPEEVDIITRNPRWPSLPK